MTGWRRGHWLSAALGATVLVGACSGASKRPLPLLQSEVTGHALEADSPLRARHMVEDIELLTSERYAGRGSYQSGGKESADYVFDELEKLGYEVRRQVVREPHAESIFAVKWGFGGAESRAAQSAVLVSAHHDHLGRGSDGRVYPGADDNASGLSVMLAIARANKDVQHRHSIIFAAFGAEEDALAGSAAFIKDPQWPLNKIEAVINFDMVGRNFFEAGSNKEATCAVVGLEDSTRARDLLREAAGENELDLVEVPARLLELFAVHDRTDDWWFRRQRIPSIHFTTGLHFDYHQTSDSADKIVPEQLERIAKSAAALVDGLAQRQ